MEQMEQMILKLLSLYIDVYKTMKNPNEPRKKLCKKGTQKKYYWTHVQ